MKSLSVIGLAVVLVLGGMTLYSQADIVAYDVPLQTGNQAWTGALGLDFDVNSTISVTQMGVFDSGGNGISGTLSVSIYRRDGTVVISPVTFTGNEGALVEGSRFKPITPVSLDPGQYSVVAWGYSSSERNGNWNNGGFGALSTENAGGAISFVGHGRWSGSTAVYPGAPSSDYNYLPSNVFNAGTFAYVPLPPSVLLLGSGLFGMGLLGWRRKLI